MPIFSKFTNLVIYRIARKIKEWLFPVQVGGGGGVDIAQ